MAYIVSLSPLLLIPPDLGREPAWVEVLGLGSVPSSALLIYITGWPCQRPSSLISEPLLLETQFSGSPAQLPGALTLPSY